MTASTSANRQAPAWTTDKSLLNPGFESYKLLAGDLTASVKPLSGNAALGRVLESASASKAEEATLGWREAKYRAAFNHLFPVDEDGLAWIDAAGGIWKITAADLEQHKGTLPQPKASNLQPHYPSIHALSTRPQHWMISDGLGTLYLFDSASSSFLASASFNTPWSDTTPFNLHLATPISESTVALLLSFPSPKNISSSGDRVRLACVHFNLKTAALQLQYMLKGDQYPNTASLQDNGRAVIVAGSSFTTLAPADAKSTAADPAPETLAPQPNALPERTPEPTFSWTQDDEAVVLSFPWPQELKDNPPQDLRVVFTPQFLNVHSPTQRQMSVSHRKLWGLIDTHTSTWALDPDRLYISLEKKHQGTTWPTVFDDSITDASLNPPQDFTPEQLAAMKDVLSHMTSDELNDAEPAATTTLLGDGADRDDLASNVDEQVTKQSLSLASEDVSDSSEAFELLSKSLIISGRPDSADQSVVVKRQVDGLVLDNNWTHIGTYAALDYVLASKRSFNLRFVVHQQQHFCVAIDATGSIFAYYGPAEPKAPTATQAVLQVDGVSEVVGAGWIPERGLLLLAKGVRVLVSGLPHVS